MQSKSPGLYYWHGKMTHGYPSQLNYFEPSADSHFRLSSWQMSNDGGFHLWILHRIQVSDSILSELHLWFLPFAAYTRFFEEPLQSFIIESFLMRNDMMWCAHRAHVGAARVLYRIQKKGLMSMRRSYQSTKRFHLYNCPQVLAKVFRGLNTWYM